MFLFPGGKEGADFGVLEVREAVELADEASDSCGNQSRSKVWRAWMIRSLESKKRFQIVWEIAVWREGLAVSSLIEEKGGYLPAAADSQ